MKARELFESKVTSKDIDLLKVQPHVKKSLKRFLNKLKAMKGVNFSEIKLEEQSPTEFWFYITEPMLRLHINRDAFVEELGSIAEGDDDVLRHEDVGGSPSVEDEDYKGDHYVVYGLTYGHRK